MLLLNLKQSLLIIKLGNLNSLSRAQPITIKSLLLVDTTQDMKASHRYALVFEPSTSWYTQIRTRI